MKTRSIITVLLIALQGASITAHAQTIKSDSAIFKEQDLSESALIDALTPEPEVRTRSIKIQRSGTQNVATAPVTSRPTEASLLITFETNSAELTQRAKTALDVVARALSSDQLSNFEFSVEGHADPTGTSSDNMRLSQLRAMSVVGYLVAAHKIPQERLRAVGKGDLNPLNLKNPNAEENRRVTIKTVLK